MAGKRDDEALEVAHPSNPVGSRPNTLHPTEIEATIGYTFRNRRLLEQALTHDFTPGLEQDTEFGSRLSWLGEASLHIVVSDLLFRTYPDAPTEELQKTRSKLTQHRILAGIGSTLGIEKFARLGPIPAGNATVAAEKEKHQIVANILVALFGAVYVDGGPHAAQRVILHTLKRRFEYIQSFGRHKKKPDTVQPLAKPVPRSQIQPSR